MEAKGRKSFLKPNQLPDFSLEVKDLNKTNTIKIIPSSQSFHKLTGRTKKYKAFPYKLRPVLEKVADYVRITMIPDTFKREGPGWAPLARRTIAERIAAGYNGQHPILYRSGDLFKELTQKSHPKHIEIIKTGKNARIEIGGSSSKFLENQRGVSGTNLPSRPMIPGTGNLPLPDRDRLAIKAIVERGIKDIMRNDRI